MEARIFPWYATFRLKLCVFRRYEQHRPVPWANLRPFRLLLTRAARSTARPFSILCTKKAFSRFLLISSTRFMARTVFFHQFAIVTDGNVALLFEFESGIDGHFAGCFTESFGPTDFTRVPLHLEVLDTLRTAETEIFSVVADECAAVAWVASWWTKVALF